jgi:hypothetical protein
MWRERKEKKWGEKKKGGDVKSSALMSVSQYSESENILPNRYVTKILIFLYFLQCTTD